MSFPNIPDVDPYIGINFEDSINLLLASIAMEEISLSKLMDAETKKILCVLKDCCYDDWEVEDALKVNKSVDNTIKNMIKLQMLLQFKLENVKELIPTTTCTTTTCTSTSSTTTCTHTHTHTHTHTYTTMSTTCTCSTTTKICSCSLIGSGKGIISNKKDEFYNSVANLSAFVCCCYDENKTIRYSVEADNANLCMNASNFNVKIKCPEHCTDKLVIYGNGYVSKNRCFKGKANFILTVCSTAFDTIEFIMEIKSDTNPKLNHNSGIVCVKGSNMKLNIFC